MTKKRPEKQAAPAPIRHALAALAQLKAEDAAAATALSRALPAYALRIARTGGDVSVESLLAAARDGRVTAREKPDTRPAFMARYETIVKNIATPHDPLAYMRKDPLSHAIITGDMEAFQENLASPRHVVNAMTLAVRHDRGDMLDTLMHAHPKYVRLGIASLMNAALNRSDNDMLEKLVLDDDIRPFINACHNKLPAVVESGNRDALQLFLDYDLYTPYELQKALTTVVVMNDRPSAQTLIDYGADPQLKKYDFLEYFKKNDGTEMLQLLADAGYKPNSSMISDVAERANVRQIEFLMQRGADPRHNNDHAVVSAAATGNNDVLRFFISLGMDINAHNGSALAYAALNGHAKTVALLLDAGVKTDKIPDLMRQQISRGYGDVMQVFIDHGHIPDNFAGIEHAVGYRRNKTLAVVLPYAAKAGVNLEELLFIATKADNPTAAALLLQHGANPDARPDAHKPALLGVAMQGHHNEIAQLLLDAGADVHAAGNEALQSAIQAKNTEGVLMLLRHGADIQTVTSLQNFTALPAEMVAILMHHGMPATAAGAQALQALALKNRAERWIKTARQYPPEKLAFKDPAQFKARAFDDITNVLKEETRFSNSTVMAYDAIALLQSSDRVLQYLEKHGKSIGRTSQPMHNLLQVLRLPDDLSRTDLKAWGDAVLKHGPQMAKLARFCDKVHAPEKSADGRTWSYTRTLRACADHAYARAAEHTELARFCFSHQQSERTFEKALDLSRRFNAVKNIPDIAIDGARFGMADVTFKKLANDDIRGLFLGELTDCCQSIGGAGAACATHGFTSENGGFYVVETRTGEIIGQSWVWRGQNGEMCLDSLETLGKRINSTQWRDIVTALAAELTARKDHNVTALHVGLGGETPASLSAAFAQATAHPVDYDDYRDSDEQCVVWQRNGNKQRKRKAL